MILLKVNHILNYYPANAAAENQITRAEGKKTLSFMGNHPHNPESGKVEISVQLLQGQFDSISVLQFVDLDPESGFLESWEKDEQDNFNILVRFDTVFLHGLKYCTQRFITNEGLILGISDGDNSSLDSIEGQHQLLSLLAGYLLPARQKEIQEFARPCIICRPNDGTDESISHFMGPRGGYLRDENAFINLATVFTADLPPSVLPGALKSVLSFYLMANAETPPGIIVINNDLEAETNDISDEHYEEASNFDMKIMLDLPGDNHSLLQHLNFTDEEKEHYETLLSTYKQVLMNDSFEAEVNKISGYPDSVQNCVAFEAEMLRSGKGFGEVKYSDATEWQLLLQVSPYCKWFEVFDEIGDSTIYVMIRREDLENEMFENCQIVTQCT